MSASTPQKPAEQPAEQLTLVGLAAAVMAAPARCGNVRLVCVDGPAGSGKTTLAASLSRRLAGAQVVHLDDLYEGWTQPLGTGLAARIDAWLLAPWEAGLPGAHLRYDWAAGKFTEWVNVPPAPVVLLEGCGSAGAGVREHAALVIWVEAPAPLRLERGLARDGAAMAGHWRAWQESESVHFARDGTAAAADVRWSGERWPPPT